MFICGKFSLDAFEIYSMRISYLFMFWEIYVPYIMQRNCHINWRNISLKQYRQMFSSFLIFGWLFNLRTHMDLKQIVKYEKLVKYLL